jgi:hypothetical protein
LQSAVTPLSFTAAPSLCCPLQAVTRAKQRLYLTCPKYRWPPRAAQQQQQVDERDDNVLAPSDFLLKLLLLKGSMLAANTPVLIEENLRVLS